MSLLLVASQMLERVGVRLRQTTDPPAALVESPPSETPRQTRDRLRLEIRARGANPHEIESISGDCDQQVATQIKNYSAWLDAQGR